MYNAMYGNHFSFKELVATQTGLDNTPSCDSHLSNLSSLWNTLNYVRQEFGFPIIVNSAYRTEQVNKQVGGSKCSLHMQGRAADIRPKDSTKLEDLWKQLQKEQNVNNCYSQLIKYPTFIHIAL